MDVKVKYVRVYVRARVINYGELFLFVGLRYLPI